MSSCTCELCLCWLSQLIWREQERGQSQWLRRGERWRDPWAGWSQGSGGDGGQAPGGQEPWPPAERRERGASSTAAGERSRRPARSKPAMYLNVALIFCLLKSKKALNCLSVWIVQFDSEIWKQERLLLHCQLCLLQPDTLPWCRPSPLCSSQWQPENCPLAWNCPQTLGCPRTTLFATFVLCH